MVAKGHWRKLINLTHVVGLTFALVLSGCAEFTGTSAKRETKRQHDKRMAWWREARFGMFIHWGLYAVPAGEWKGTTNHAEWILTTAQIPVKEYEKFCPQFNPVKFNANEWVRIAKEAGMKYIVITSKHHDGFCLWESKLTDYDVIDATPFKRDILRELTTECKKQGIRMCFYHSIMDWHHPDYLPRRDWEKRPSEGADFSHYVSYMKGQVTEIIDQYDPGVLWFDGEWESTWDADLGDDLYAYVRSLKPDIIVNNRVSKGRAGMEGTYDPKKFSGDFGTPEQEIPATGLGYDWETCMTMNNHWGYNKHDDNWKPTEDLIRKLVDIASKGGNFLLNVGPTAEGLIPQPSVERLQQMGDWLKVNGQSIYGTTASPFRKLQWGRCTQKQLAKGHTRLYLHVFDWPTDGKLKVSGLDNKLTKAFLLARGEHSWLRTTRKGNDLIIDVPLQVPDPTVSVVALDIKGKPIVIEAPEVVADADIFIDKAEVTIKGRVENSQIRYTLDGSAPESDSQVYKRPVTIEDSATVTARLFRNGKAISDVTKRTLKKVQPRPPEKAEALAQGLCYEYYEGEWDKLPDFDSLEPRATGTVATFDIDLRQREEKFGFRFRGYLKVPRPGVYTFNLESDDGSRLYIGDQCVVDNDGLHGNIEKSGMIALAKGLHPITVVFFEKTGSENLEVYRFGPQLEEPDILPTELFHSENQK